MCSLSPRVAQQVGKTACRMHTCGEVNLGSIFFHGQDRWLPYRRSERIEWS